MTLPAIPSIGCARSSTNSSLPRPQFPHSPKWENFSSTVTSLSSIRPALVRAARSGWLQRGSQPDLPTLGKRNVVEQHCISASGVTDFVGHTSGRTPLATGSHVYAPPLGNGVQLECGPTGRGSGPLHRAGICLRRLPWYMPSGRRGRSRVGDGHFHLFSLLAWGGAVRQIRTAPAPLEIGGTAESVRSPSSQKAEAAADAASVLSSWLRVNDKYKQFQNVTCNGWLVPTITHRTPQVRAERCPMNCALHEKSSGTVTNRLEQIIRGT